MKKRQESEAKAECASSATPDFVDGEFTIKQFKMDESGTFGWLIPWNSEFSPIRVDETNRFMVWGVVTYVIHQIAE